LFQLEIFFKTMIQQKRRFNSTLSNYNALKSGHCKTEYF